MLWVASQFHHRKDTRQLDILPIPQAGWDCGPREPGFLLRRDEPSTVPFVFGLTVSPQACAFPQALRYVLSLLVIGCMVLATGKRKRVCTLVNTLVFLPAEAIYCGTLEALFHCQGTTRLFLQSARKVEVRSIRDQEVR